MHPVGSSSNAVQIHASKLAAEVLDLQNRINEIFHQIQQLSVNELNELFRGLCEEQHSQSSISTQLRNTINEELKRRHAHVHSLR